MYTLTQSFKQDSVVAKCTRPKVDDNNHKTLSKRKLWRYFNDKSTPKILAIKISGRRIRVSN